MITEAPQKDIWLVGRTYPMKAVAMVISRMDTPTDHKCIFLKEPIAMPRPVWINKQTKNKLAPLECRYRISQESSIDPMLVARCLYLEEISETYEPAMVNPLTN